MEKVVRGGDISGETKSPPSKSYTHRAILVGALSDKMKVLDPLMSADPKASIRCAEALGADVDIQGDELVIDGVDGRPEVPDRVMDCGNAGTTTRLFIGAASLVDGAAVLSGDESLRERPNGPLLSSINELGGEAFSTRGNGQAPIVVHGPIEGGETEIDGTVSSQFITSLLINLPMTDRGGEIKVQGELKSRPYVDITLDVLDKGGVDYEETSEGFKVDEGQRYSADEFQVPGDFSSASYPLALGALNGEVKAKNLYPSAQGDSYIVELLDKMGADIEWDKSEGVVTVEESDLSGIEFDAQDNPDLVPTIAVLGTAASGKTRIVNAEHLRFKETDRLEAVATELSKMGAEIEEGEDYLVIDGDKSELEGAEVDGRHDHRIVMVLALAGSIASGETTISTVESVEVSYPDFFERMSGIGLEIE